MTYIIKLGLTLTLLTCVIVTLDFSGWVFDDVNKNPYPVIGAAVALLLSLLLASTRWSFFLRTAKLGSSITSETKIYLFSILLNQGMPATLGGDLYRAWKMSPTDGFVLNQKTPSIMGRLNNFFLSRILIF